VCVFILVYTSLKLEEDRKRSRVHGLVKAADGTSQ